MTLQRRARSTECPRGLSALGFLAVLLCPIPPGERTHSTARKDCTHTFTYVVCASSHACPDRAPRPRGPICDKTEERSNPRDRCVDVPEAQAG
eukprot:855525-Prymnesium_polylepis.1